MYICIDDEDACSENIQMTTSARSNKGRKSSSRNMEASSDEPDHRSLGERKKDALRLSASSNKPDGEDVRKKFGFFPADLDPAEIKIFWPKI